MPTPPERRPAVLEDPGVEVSDPRALLVAYLDWYRRAVRRKLDGLTDEQLRSPVEPLGWAPLGLVQHLGWVERRWMRWGFAAEDVVAYSPDGDEAEWDVSGTSSTDVFGAYDEEVRRSEELVAGAQLGDSSRTGGRFPTAADVPSLGRILFHLLQEYARHVGQLDIARELIDGRTGE